jgi:hypothetical protein
MRVEKVSRKIDGGEGIAAAARGSAAGGLS